MKQRTVLISLIMLLLVFVLFSGCTTQMPGSGTPIATTAPTVTPTLQPTTATPIPTIPENPTQVRITSPHDIGIAGPANFTVTIVVENFRLVDSLGAANVPGEGHVHYFLDVDAPTTPGMPAIPATGRYAPTANTSYTWTEVSGGFHIVAVELVNNDHTPLVPPVTDTITVLVGREGAGGSGGGGGGGY